MPGRKVFGKRSHAQHDAFASMLHSSPDVKIIDEVEASRKQDSIQDNTDLRRSPRRKQVSALQLVSANIVRPSGKQPFQKKVELPGRSKQDNLISNTTKSDAEGVTRQHKQDLCSSDRNQCASRRTEIDNATQQSIPPGKQEPVEQCSASSCPYTEHCKPLLQLFKQQVEDFSAWSSQLSEHLNVSKIAEASFGEVYRLSLKPKTKDQNIHVSHHEESVLKIIALTPPDSTIPTTKRERNKVLKKAALMSKPADVASEIRLLQRMSNIPGYTDFREMRLLKGRPTSAFTKAYKQYNITQQANGKDPSTFPDPAKKSSYSPDQLWAVIEMRDAGTDLERLVEQGTCRDVWSIWDIFWQTTLALAKGEEGAEFEHRDLHLGNICVRRKGSSSQVDFTKRLNFTKLDVTLIDYTISRATIQPDKQSATTDIAYLDLSHDQHIFNGDSAQEYQYDIYRYMRSALFLDNPLAAFDDTQLDSTRKWSQFHPQTNLVWLHFVLYTLLDQISSAGSWPKPVNKAERQALKRAKELERILFEVDDLLNPSHVIENGLRSASILVATALEREWLFEEDVLGPEDSAVDLTSEIAALTVHDLDE